MIFIFNINILNIFISRNTSIMAKYRMVFILVRKQLGKLKNSLIKESNKMHFKSESYLHKNLLLLLPKKILNI